MVLLVTSDNEQFQTEKDIVERSVLIKNMLEDVGESDQPIPLPNVSSSVLKKVTQPSTGPTEIDVRGRYLSTASTTVESPSRPPILEQSQDETRKRTTDISEWDQKFITVDQEMLFEIILAANYLDIKSLLCRRWLQDGSQHDQGARPPEEIRKLFNIVNDFTPEEEAQIKKENEWAEDR
ncbi:E3 ubiquitin ligase complex SCF subunit sconC [Mycena sanguinolenta]|uniref:E3 ubiquitin ligase complex SCF subunit n=1 Tax=Mycena sanguinolenta TaxID=230812 RepID=A0A8H6YR17_9AGAR|nr:E3 ubiquitin ligase complex SCF subunit sconC [Mycena sanguinolenta]